MKPSLNSRLAPFPLCIIPLAWIQAALNKLSPLGTEVGSLAPMAIVGGQSATDDIHSPSGKGATAEATVCSFVQESEPDLMHHFFLLGFCLVFQRVAQDLAYTAFTAPRVA
jgi:hypothetical protein